MILILYPIPFVRDRPPPPLPKKKWNDVKFIFIFFDILYSMQVQYMVYVQIEGRRLVLQEGLRGGSQDDGSFGTSVTSYFYA
jgi:hypothetical protein